MKRLTYSAIALLAFIITSRTSLAQDSGAEIYKAKCEMCHGADGQSNTPVGKSLGAQAYTSPEVLKLSDAQITDVIKHGKNKMPPAQVTDDQIKALLPYIHSLQKKK